MKRGAFIFLSIFVTWTAGTAWAQTPDGETPSEETDCDGLPGPLFGLCNAYCEAMDCDTGANADDRACERVLANYHRQSGGEDPPCLGSADCCEEHPTPSCDDAECAEQVCGFLPACCTGVWDDLCAFAAGELCVTCGAGTELPPT